MVGEEGVVVEHGAEVSLHDRCMDIQLHSARSPQDDGAREPAFPPPVQWGNLPSAAGPDEHVNGALEIHRRTTRSASKEVRHEVSG